MGRAERIGSIDVGKAGDLVVLENPAYDFMAYHIGVNTVEKVVKSGSIVYDRHRCPQIMR